MTCKKVLYISKTQPPPKYELNEVLKFQLIYYIKNYS